MSDQVAEIKQKIDITSLIGERIKLSRSGSNFKALCPFHGERTPSFMVSPELQFYKCFGCGKSGDAYSFLQEYDGMDFPEALEHLAKQAGVQLVKARQDKASVRKKRLYEILHIASEYYHYLLTEHEVGKSGLRYLTERGIQKRSIEAYKLGFAPDSWDSLYRYFAKKKNYSIGDLESVGLVLRKRGVYDRFRRRIMFPLREVRGNIVGFSGRVLPGEEMTGGKYINSPETEIYHKSKHVYGLFENRSFIKKKDQVVVVEGEFDVISSWQVGVKQVVAVKGTAFTQDQVALLRRYSRNVVLALDADGAGDLATKRSIKVLDSATMNVRVGVLSGGKDPDAVAQGNKDKWKKIIAKSFSVYDFFLRSAKRRYDLTTGLGKKQASEEVIPILSGISNVVEQAHYIKKFAKILDVSGESVVEEIRRWERSKQLEGVAVEKKDSLGEAGKERSRQNVLEDYLLSLVFQGGKEGLKVLKKKPDVYIKSSGISLIFKRLLKVDLRAYDPSRFIRELPAELQSLAQNAFLIEVEDLTSDTDWLGKETEKVIGELELLGVREKIDELSGKIASLENKEKLNDKEELRFDRLQRKFAKLSRQLSR